MKGAFMRTLHPAEIAARKTRREQEGKVNMARYLEQQQGTRDKTARLRAQRLALPEMRNPDQPVKKALAANGSSPRRPLPGLQQGIRG
jgi:hypothetical protein